MKTRIIVACIGLPVLLAVLFFAPLWAMGIVVGAIAAGFVAFQAGPVLSGGLTLILMCLAAMVAAGLYGLVVAALKVKFGTNETLMTLMLNYIALYVLIYIGETKADWNFFLKAEDLRPVPQKLPESAMFPTFPMGEKFELSLCVILVFVIAALIYVYLKHTKQGYEISVVGESENTARYIGINVKKVIIRTMIISGAICGLAGLLLVGGTNHTISTTTVGGRGFTAIMVSWLAKFNPIYMIFTSLLIVFLEKGASKISEVYRLNSSFSDIITGIIIFFIIGAEFFINYKNIVLSKRFHYARYFFNSYKTT